MYNNNEENILGKVNLAQKPRLNMEDEKRLVSKVFMALVIMIVVMLGVQFAMDAFVQWKYPEFYDTNRYLWLLMLVSQYLLAYPIVIMLIARTPEHTIKEKSLSAKELFACFLVCYSLVILGNFMGIGFNSILESLFGIETALEMDTLILESNRLLVLVVAVIMGPFAEEWIFRKSLLDRLVKYGELPAIVASALIFGLFHGNFSQFFYAFLVGLVFGYIYVKTGKLRYSVILHMAVNFCGTMFPLMVMDLNNTSLLGFYVAVEMALLVIGIVILMKKRKEVVFNSSDYAITDKEGKEIIWKNKGAYIMLTAFVVLFIWGMI